MSGMSPYVWHVSEYVSVCLVCLRVCLSMSQYVSEYVSVCLVCLSMSQSMSGMSGVSQTMSQYVWYVSEYVSVCLSMPHVLQRVSRGLGPLFCL